MADKQYVAIAPLVIAKEEQGRDVYVYEGAPVPDYVTDESIKNLLEGGFIKESEGPTPGEPKGYADQKVDDLKALIETRNAGREDADKIDGSGKKDDLVAALAADDEKSKQ